MLAFKFADILKENKVKMNMNIFFLENEPEHLARENRLSSKI